MNFTNENLTKMTFLILISFHDSNSNFLIIDFV